MKHKEIYGLLAALALAAGAAVSCLEEPFVSPDYNKPLWYAREFEFKTNIETGELLTKAIAVPDSSGIDSTNRRRVIVTDTLEIYCSEYDYIAVDSAALGLTPAATGKKGGRKTAAAEATKAAPVESIYSDIALYGYVFDGAWKGDSEYPNLLYNTRYEKATDLWTSPESHKWPGGPDRRVRFYASTPYTAEGWSPLTEAEDVGAPAFDYAIPLDAVDQTDILVGQSDTDYAGDSNAIARLDFHHVLSAVQFRTGPVTAEGTFKSITLKNLYSAAEYECADHEWYIDEDWKDDLVTEPNAAVTGLPGEVITTGEDTFMLIPQTTPDDARIEIVFNDGDRDYVLTSSFAGETFIQGHTKVYELNTPTVGYNIDLSKEAFPLTAAPSDETFTLTVGHPWTITSDQPWATVSQTSGERGRMDITVHTEGNQTLESRTATLTVRITGTTFTKTFTVTQTPDEIVNTTYSDIDITSFSFEAVDAAAHTVTPAALTYKQIQTNYWLSTRVEPIEHTDGATTTYSIPTAATGFTLKETSTGKIDVANNPQGAQRSVTINVNVAKNGKNSNKTATLTQQADVITNTKYEIAAISASPATITAAGGTSAISGGAGTITYTWKSETTTSGTFTPDKAVSGAQNPTYDKTTDKVTIAPNQGNQRTYTVTFSYTPSTPATGTLTAPDSKTCTITQDGDSLASIAITASPASVAAAGGSSSIDCTATYVSGKTATVTPTVSCSANSANSTFSGSVSGTTVTIPSLGTTVVAAGTYTVSASYTEAGVTRTTTCTISQAENALTGLAISPSPTSVGAGGGTSAISATATYSSGSSKGVTPTLTGAGQNSANSTFKGSYSGTTVTIPSLGTTTVSAGTYTVSASFTDGGVSKTASCTVSQASNQIDSYDNPTVSAFGYDTVTHAASGGTSTVNNLTYTQTAHWASGSTTTASSGGSVSYSGSATGFSVNASNGTVTSSANQGAARSITVTVTVTLNGKSGTKTATVNQNADSISYYDAPAVTFSYSPASHTAAGGTSSPSVSYTQTVHYVSGRTTTASSGGSVSYSGSATGFTLASDGKVTAAVNTGAARSITVTASVTLNGKTGTKTATVSQSADAISYYDAPTGLSITCSDVPAGGGSITSGSVSGTCSQVVHYVSGTTKTINPTYSGSWSGGASNIASKGSTASSRSSTGKTLTYTYTANGKSNSTSCTVYQAANQINSYDNPTVTAFEYNSTTHSAAGGTSTVSRLTYSQTAHWASGSTTTVTSGGSASYSGSATGFTVNTSNGTVTSSANTGAARSVTVTVTVTVNGKSGTKTATVSQSADAISYYDAPTGLSITCSDVPAGGGSVTSGSVSGTCSQVVHYVSGTTKTINPSYSGSWSGGASNIASKGSTESSRSSTGKTLTYTYTANGKSNSASCTVYQAANAVTNSHHNDRLTAYGTPSISIGSGITAGGGSATVSASVSNTYQDQTLYTSGSTENNTPRSVAGSVTLSIVTNGNNRFSLSGTTLSHSSMGTSATTDNVTVRAYNAASTGYYKDASTSVSNGISSYGAVTVTAFTYTPASHTSAGGTSTPSVSFTQTATWSSGSPSTITSGGTKSYSGSATGFTLSTDGSVKAAANTGAARSITVTVTVTVNGKSGTKTATVSQEKPAKATCKFTASVFNGGRTLSITASQPPASMVEVTFTLMYTNSQGRILQLRNQSVTFAAGTQSITDAATLPSGGTAITGGKITAVSPTSDATYDYTF